MTNNMANPAKHIAAISFMMSSERIVSSMSSDRSISSDVLMTTRSRYGSPTIATRRTGVRTVGKHS